MKLLVCGPRDWNDRDIVWGNLDMYLGRGIAEVIAGGAPGVDTFAVDWAEHRGIGYTVHEADWKRYGTAAGPKRNLKMLSDNPHGVLAFRYVGQPVTRGTTDMVTKAVQFGISVHFVPGARKSISSMIGHYHQAAGELQRSLADPSGCEKAPAGWHCSRESGHSGPCAARQIEPKLPYPTAAMLRSLGLPAPDVDRPSDGLPPLPGGRTRPSVDNFDGNRDGF